MDTGLRRIHIIVNGRLSQGKAFTRFVHYHVDTSASPSRMYRVGGGICIVHLVCRVVALGASIFCGFYLVSFMGSSEAGFM